MYDKEKIKQKSINLIKEHNLIFIEDVVSLLPCSKSSFYDWSLNIHEGITSAIECNKTNLKIGLRSKWYESNNATTQIALYKLISNDQEKAILSNQEHKENDSNSITGFTIEPPELGHLETEELENILAIYKKAEVRLQ